LRFFLCYYLW